MQTVHLPLQEHQQSQDLPLKFSYDVGKYLSPDLYISYGRSLFSDQYLVSARYSLSKKLELESKAGMETSVDLFYKIEFD